MTVVRVERHIINKAHQFYQKVDALCLASKNLYNACVYTSRQSFFYGHGVPSWAKLDAMFRDNPLYKAMPAKVSQLVTKQVSDAWESYFKAMSAYRESSSKFTGCPKIPGYKDTETGRNLVKYNNQAYSKKLLKSQRVISPSMTQIKVPVKEGITPHNLLEIRLVPRFGHYVIEVVYETRVDQVSTPSESNAAAIDLGLDNLATIVFSDVRLKPLIINGKPLKAANQWWNKQKAKAFSLLPSCQHTSRRIENITQRRNNYVSNYMHNATSVIVKELQLRCVTKVAIGKNDHWKQGIKLGRRNNQNFVQIPYNKFIEQLTYKLEEVGIQAIVAEESYTSKSSMLDWDNIPIYSQVPKNQKPSFSGKRIKRAWYKSKDGTLIHADVNAAFNIGRKVVPMEFDCLKSIVLRDRGLLVVNPRRITPVCRT